MRCPSCGYQESKVVDSRSADDGATVKRFFREADHIRLQPENSAMDPIITTDCSIAGKVVAVFRRL